MIELVTGTPGAGKSAYTLSRLYEKLQQSDVRPLFVHGVPDLLIPHFPVYCESPTCEHCRALPSTAGMEKAEEWHLWAPEGAVLWFDEVQHVYRPRSSTAKVPESVAAFETHRHKGLDFYLTTQHPKLVDQNIRRLVGKHIHLKATWLNRQMYEWPEAQDNVQSTADATRSNYVLPKHVFKLYRSATLHTKVERKIPYQVWVLLGSVLLSSVLGYRVYSRLSDKIDGKPDQVAQQVESQPLRNSGTDTSQPDQAPARQPADLAKFDYTPKLPNVPESAPAFVELAKPVSYPRLSGCIVDRKQPEGCRCYTQQATPYFVSSDQCRAYVKYGRFDPYRPDGTRGGSADTRTGGTGRGEPPRNVAAG